MRRIGVGAAIAAACVAAFVWGVAAGRYKVFPYGVIRDAVHAGREAAGLGEAPAATLPVLYPVSNMITLQATPIPLPAFEGQGGALALLGDRAFFVTPHGRLGWVDATRDPIPPVRMIAGGVPMNLDGLLASDIPRQPKFKLSDFRTMGLHAEPAPGGVDLYVFHHHYQDECLSLRLSRMRIAIDETAATGRVTDARTLFDSAPCIRPDYDKFYYGGNQGGGRIIEETADTLLVSVGDLSLDGYNAPETVSQDPAVPYGKILRIPKAGGDWQIVAMGLRNPQGLFRDDRGRIWESEHGPRGGDELNLIEEGENYGWPFVTLGVDYDTGDWPLSKDQGRHDGYTPPVLGWVPSIAPSNIAQASGAAFPMWAGDLLVGGMKFMTLHRIRLQGSRVLFDEPIPFGERIRDMASLPDGRLVLMTDQSRLYLVEEHHAGEAAPGVAAAPAPDEGLGAPAAGPAFPPGRLLFERKCSSCHRLDPRNEGGPHLAGLKGRGVAGAAGFAYSPALAGAGGVWDEDLFVRFVRAPAETFPGAVMPPAPVDEAEAREIWDYLE